MLGVARGNARVLLGGPGGIEITLAAGDALLLPAGTGHCRLSASADFMVVGAYPAGQDWDICRQAPDAAMLQRIAQVPVPQSDPLLGTGGPVLEYWRMQNPLR
ncbi:hypothetical protein ACM9W9_01665 [Xanthomonas sacchari]